MDVYRKLKEFYWPYRWLGLVSLCCVFLMAAVGLARPNLIRLLVDRVIVGRHYGELPYLALGVVAVAAARGTFHYGRAYLGHVFGANAVYALRNALYKKLQFFSLTFYDRVATGDLMSRLAGDVELFRQFLAFGLANLLDFGLIFAFGLAMMLTIDIQLTLTSLAAMPFLVVVVLRFYAMAHPAFTAIQEAIADLASAVQESITGIRTIKSFAREPHQIEHFGNRNRQYMERYMFAARLWSKYFPMMELLGNVALLLLFWFGSRRVIQGDMTIGELVAFFSLIWYIVGPLQQVGYHINNLTQSVAAGERLIEILQTPSMTPDSCDALELESIQGHVRFENVSFAYDGEHEVLSEVSLDARPGSAIALLGPTGSGKSTLVSLILRCYDPTGGRVTIDGHDVRSIKLSSLRRQVGVVFQETFLFSTSIRENISYGRREASLEEIIEAAKMAQAHEFIMTTPDGYDTIVGERGMGLSGGEKQRIAIARAILADPRILILDDATASVDMETEYEIQQALKALIQGRTTFIIAHRLSSLKYADEILVLDRGSVIERGTHEELIRQHGIYRRIYEVQFSDWKGRTPSDHDPRCDRTVCL